MVVHRAFGSSLNPVAVPNCAVIQRVADRAAPDGEVVAAKREPNAIAALTQHPDDWVPDPVNQTLTPLSDGSASGSVSVPAAGRYRVWVGGSARGKVSVEVGEQAAGSARGQLNNDGQFIQLDELDLQAGELPVTMAYERGGSLRPAVGSYPFGIGPVLLEPLDGGEIVRLRPIDAQEICGSSLDWIEAVR